MGPVDVIQALRASLAGKWVSDEDYSIYNTGTEPTSLGFSSGSTLKRER